MVEEDAATGEQAVGVAVVGDFPERGRFRDGVGTARPKRRGLIGGSSAGVAEALAGTGVVEPDRTAEKPDRLQKVECAGGDAFEGFHRLLEGEADRTLPGQVINLVRRDLGEGLQGAPKVGEDHGFHGDLLADAQADKIAEIRDLGIAGGTDNAVASR